MERDRKSKARAKALRAARVVSIAASLALGPAACSQSHGPDPSRDASTPDAEPPRDAARDAAKDARVADGGHDAGHCPDDPWTGSCCEPMPEECCTEMGLTWNDADDCCVTCVEGPLVPPSAAV